jgi:acyl-CoA synthetase (AMP-forming)/AMP-acid ligase II
MYVICWQIADPRRAVRWLMSLRPGGADLTIASGIRAFAAASPSVVAIRDGGRELTFAGLRDRSCRVGSGLLCAGLGPGDRVAVLMGNRLEYPEIAAGLAMAGLVMVPLNPRLTEGEISYILGHSAARAVVIDDSYAAAAGPAIADLGIPVVWSLDGTTVGPAYEDALDRAGRPNRPPRSPSLILSAWPTHPARPAARRASRLAIDRDPLRSTRPRWSGALAPAAAPSRSHRCTTEPASLSPTAPRTAAEQ